MRTNNNNGYGSGNTDWLGWAQLISAAVGPYVAEATRKPGTYKPQPETPEERALRVHAQRFAGVPGPDGRVQPGAMPTMSYIGPQIHNMLQNFQSEGNAYTPLNMLDPVTGKPVPRPAGPVRNLTDFNALIQPWTGRTAGGAPPAGAPAEANPNRGGSGFGSPAGVGAGNIRHKTFVDPSDGMGGAVGHIWSDGSGQGAGAPKWGEPIGAWLERNPGASPSDYEKYYPSTQPNPNASGMGGLNQGRGYNPNDPDSFLPANIEPPPGTDQGMWQKFLDGFNRFRAATPRWMDMGVSGIAGAIAQGSGIPAPLATRFVMWIMGGNNNGAGRVPQGGG